MSEIITVHRDYPLFVHDDPWTCFHRDCLKEAHILIVADEDYLRAQGISEHDDIWLIALCPVHYEEWRVFKKTSTLKGQQRVNSER